MTSQPPLEEIEKLLQSDKRLQRDKGVAQLDRLTNDAHLLALARRLLATLLDSNRAEVMWQMLHGCMLGMKCIVVKFAKRPDALFPEADGVDALRARALAMLRHDEVRVRTVSGELMGAICRTYGASVYAKSGVELLELLRDDLLRHLDDDVIEDLDVEEERRRRLSNGSGGSRSPSPRRMSSPGAGGLRRLSSDSERERRFSSGSDASEIFHQSAGWRHLETSMKCLQHLIEACGSDFSQYIDDELLDILFSTLQHENRFVRETGFNVCGSVLHHTGGVLPRHRENIAARLADGLADNWSQVRLAASVATRSFLAALKDPEKHFGVLLPRLCLNRYYVADGVRIYSQQSWQQLVGPNGGRQLVERHIDAVVEYYVEATGADNHAVREAACACISELATKISPDACARHVPALLSALLACFHDDSWPVRDAACVACGNFLLQYHVDVSADHRDQLFKLFLANLRDPIASVRQGAGVALGKFAKVYGTEPNVAAAIEREIRDGLAAIATQPAHVENRAGLDKKPATFGVAKTLYQDDKHTDQIMYSCGSLAPKMGRGGGGGGCSNHNFRRPSEPWERSDGAVYFMTELARHEPQTAVKFIQDLVKSLTHHHFSQHLVFHETVCKQLPDFAALVGKKVFKSHLEHFFDSIFYALSCDVPLTSVAAEGCLDRLARLIGPGILRGRVEMHNPDFLPSFDRAVFATQRRASQPPGSLSSEISTIGQS